MHTKTLRWAGVIRNDAAMSEQDARALAPGIPRRDRILIATCTLLICALAWAYLARMYQINYGFELAEVDTPIDKSIAYAYQALLVEPTSARI